MNGDEPGHWFAVDYYNASLINVLYGPRKHEKEANGTEKDHFWRLAADIPEEEYNTLYGPLRYGQFFYLLDPLSIQAVRRG